MKRIKIKYLFQYEVVVKTSIKVWDSQQRFTIQFNTQKPCKARQRLQTRSRNYPSLEKECSKRTGQYYEETVQNCQ